MTDTERLVKLFEIHNKMFIKLADMILWVAGRTLTDKEFKKFWDKFADIK